VRLKSKSIQRNETLLNTAQQWQQQVQHIVECLSEAEQHAYLINLLGHLLKIGS
jgi:uncharacterized membrane-anchored protein